ncbi:MAG: hypothetical protein HY698_04320 [Deltaproteobacteria bacterium]|nr:hypothetical protein [Deltaproteobacteria bacterium]
MNNCTTAACTVSLLALLTACSSGNTTGDGKDIPSPEESPTTDGRSPRPESKQLSLAGSYELESQFDLVSGIPGLAGAVVGEFIEMTDDRDDPATWLLDRSMEQMPGTLKAVIQVLRPGLDAILNEVILNEVILSESPEFVTTIRDLGNDFGQVAKKFGLVTQLDLAKTPRPAEFQGTHQVLGIFFDVDGAVQEYSVEEVGLGQIVARDVAVSPGELDAISVGEHALNISYGSMLRFALNRVLIPLIDPTSDTLAELLSALIDCRSLGRELSSTIGYDVTGTFTAACRVGILASSTFIDKQLDQVDGNASSMVLEGEARATDSNTDRTVDKLHSGLWEGELKLGPITSVLAKPVQTFHGERK